jgi:hypothetical protein
MEGLFFAQFDNILGPIVVCQAVNDASGQLDRETFDRVSDLVIARKELCGSLLTVSDGPSGRKIMSCPLFVENEKLYNRNAFFFAFGLVLREETATGPFRLVLRKLSHAMRSLELETQFLSRPDSERRVGEILNRALGELSQWGECIVKIDAANTLALKIIPRLVDPPDVFDHQVPVLIRDLEGIVTKEWDLTVLQVLRLIDGERHIRLIAEMSSVAVALVRRCVRQLIYFRCVKLVDIFQYSNVYTVTPRLVELAENETLRRHCQRFVWTGAGELPNGTKLFQLYAALQHGLELKDFCLLHDTSAHNVDEKKLVTFGVLHGLIRRVHRFPVLGPGVSRAQLAAAATAAPLAAAPPAAAGAPPAGVAASGGAATGAPATAPALAISGAGTGSGSGSSSGVGAASTPPAPGLPAAQAPGASAAASSEAGGAGDSGSSAAGKLQLSEAHRLYIESITSAMRWSPEAAEVAGKQQAADMIESSGSMPLTKGGGGEMDEDDLLPRAAAQATVWEGDVDALANGRNCFDAVCTELWRSMAELDAELRHHPNYALVHRG